MAKWLLLLALSVAATQTTPSPVRAAVVIDEYFGETYTASRRDPIGYAFFVGEPIRLRLLLTNRKDVVAEVRLAAVAGAETFVATVRDGNRLRTVEVRYGEARVRLVTGALSDLNDTTLELEPLQSLEWEAQIVDSLPVGVHRIVFATTIADAQDRRILWQTPNISIEIRDRNGAAAEIARRDSLRELRAGDADSLKRAEAAADRLLGIHPRSHEAFLIKGRVASERGESQRGRELAARALEILKNDQDELLLRFRDRATIARVRRDVELQMKK